MNAKVASKVQKNMTVLAQGDGDGGEGRRTAGAVMAAFVTGWVLENAFTNKKLNTQVAITTLPEPQISIVFRN